MTHETITPTQQTTVGGEAAEQEHVHPAQLHTHDHYHVTHHHTGGAILGGEFEHRSHYHSHEHNHAPLVHGHDHDPADERMDHEKEAHVHDHNDPAGDGS